MDTAVISAGIRTPCRSPSLESSIQLQGSRTSPSLSSDEDDVLLQGADDLVDHDLAVAGFTGDCTGTAE